MLQFLSTLSLTVVIGVPWLPWFSDEPEVEPESEPADVVETQPEETVEVPPPEPPAPDLFPEPLPFHPTLTVSPLGMTYASSCAGCHPSAFAEWTGSTHHTGAQSVEWLNAIRSFGDGTVCTSCHRPFTEQHAEMTTEIIEGDVSRPVMQPNDGWNPTRTTESVGCAACHVREGVIVGQKTSDSPHPVRNSTEIGTSEACQSCHQFQLPDEDAPIYNTYQEWRNSAYANAGVQCQDCHMVEGATIGNGTHNHNMHLSTTQGITVTLQTPAFEFARSTVHPFTVVLHNSGVGHTWPGSSPFVQKSLIIRVNDDSGKSIMKDIVHPIGRHRTEELSGPSLAVANQHAFQSDLYVLSKHRPGWVQVSIIYQNGSTEEVLQTIAMELK